MTIPRVRPQIPPQRDAFEGLIIDLFAGGGGASTGIEAALGRPVDIGINHDPVALAVHKENHPATHHVEENIWRADPRKLIGDRPVSLLWASPDCTHFSLAKGGKPRDKKLRTLAWAVCRWAKWTKPLVICMENVREFEGWGPLTRDGQPDKRFLGKTFKAWRRRLERLGYVVDHRMVDASRLGVPTKRKRLFIIARRDGLPIIWPEATHGVTLKPVRIAGECVDFTRICPSIFEQRWSKKLKKWVDRLKPKTMWRIARGMERFVFGTPTPFIVKVNHGKKQDRSQGLDEPLSTITATQRGHAIVTPFIARTAHGDVDRKGKRRGKGQHPIDEPLPTVTANGKDFALAAATLIQTGYGEREGQKPRNPGLDKPLGTVVAGGQKHALVEAFLATFVTKHYGDRGQRPGSAMTEPLATITASDHNALTAAHLVKLRGDCHSSGMDESVPTISAQGNHVAEVRAFLTAYHASDYAGGFGQALTDPMRTITTKDRLGLVTIHGVDYQIVDIGMRMLDPDELLRAQFGRFAEAYDLSAAIGERALKKLAKRARAERRSLIDLILETPRKKRRPTKAAMVRLIGNSVCPEVAEAIVRANCAETPSKVRRAA